MARVHTLKNYFETLDPRQPRTYYENLFTRPVSDVSEYIYKLELLVAQEKSCCDKSNETTLIMLQNKLDNARKFRYGKH